jgi:hypothetical protein
MYIAWEAFTAEKEREREDRKWWVASSRLLVINMHVKPYASSINRQTLTDPSSPALANIPLPFLSSLKHHCKPFTSPSP